MCSLWSSEQVSTIPRWRCYGQGRGPLLLRLPRHQWRRRLVFGLERSLRTKPEASKSTGPILLCRLNGNRHLAQVHCDDDQPNQNNHEQPSRHYDSAHAVSGWAFVSGVAADAAGSIPQGESLR